MSNKSSGSLNLATLKKLPFEQLQAESVTAVLLALGSNYQAKYYLPLVRKKLASLGEMKLSTAFQNPDFTATIEQPKPDYTNQCVYLSLNQSMTLNEIQQIFKQFEKDCGRQRVSESAKNPIETVTMDIDILLIKLDIEKNSLSIELKSDYKCINAAEWIIMADRYPFKEHEIVGLEELSVEIYHTSQD